METTPLSANLLATPLVDAQGRVTVTWQRLLARWLLGQDAASGSLVYAALAPILLIDLPAPALGPLVPLEEQIATAYAPLASGENLPEAYLPSWSTDPQPDLYTVGGYV